MSRRRPQAHPDHASEQAYIEDVHRCEQLARDRKSRQAEAAPDKATARALHKQALQVLRNPTDLDALCFGRMDLEQGRELYLGRGAVRNEDNRLLVINWSAPAARPFYTASRSDPEGVALRRRFQLDQLRLLGIVDERFAEAPAPAPAPKPTPRNRGRDLAAATTRPLEPAPEPPTAQPEPTLDGEPTAEVVDAILADMDRARGTEMRDIVATIEAQQYELISDAIDGLLVIQGGPGSGKTAIALHRAAWLLFNHREELERSGVLVVGPNRAFMEYVAQVLPSLGETSVVQSAVDRLPDLDDVRVRARETPEVARLKGELRMVDVVRRAVAERVRVPQADIEVSVGRARTALTVAEIEDLVKRARASSAADYLAQREQFGRMLLDLVTERIGGGNFLRSGTRAGEIEMAVTGSRGVADRIWPTVTAPEVLRDLLNSRQRLAAVGKALTTDERALLQRDRASSLRDEPWTPADIPLLDEADAAIRGTQARFGYVLVDEAQDLTPMQLRMVFRRSPSGRGTLVGDIAQATGPIRHRSWLELLTASALTRHHRVAELVIGYRVPRQIMDVASALLPRIAPDLTPVRAVRSGPEDPRVARVSAGSLLPTFVEEARRRLDGSRSVGLIAPLALIDDARAALTGAGLDVGDVLTDGLSRKLTLLSPAQAKGLEFDHVIVLEPALMAGASGDWAFAYVALTRATRTLAIIHTTPQPLELPPAPTEDLPPVATAPTELVPPPITDGPYLGARFTEALMLAKFLHSDDRRRGTTVPYFAHLQAVCALVLEDGGSEDEAIAALLHDAIEDHGPQMLQRIASQFGTDVARIVAECADPDDEDGMSWRELKVQHIRGLESAGPHARRVSLAEKLDNARAILRDYRRFGDRLWERMDVNAEDLLWYLAALADLFVTERPGDMASELQDTITRLLTMASEPEPATAE
jgi:DNA helicase IV